MKVFRCVQNCFIVRDRSRTESGNEVEVDCSRFIALGRSISSQPSEQHINCCDFLYRFLAKSDYVTFG